MKTPEQWMEEAIRLGEIGMERGEGGPFGALVIHEGSILGRGWNRVLATNDPTAHAEIVAIREACFRRGSYWLEDCQMVVNCEPCPMCLAAIYWARIPSLIFGASRHDAAAIGFDDQRIYKQISMDRDERSLQIRSVCGAQAAASMRRWLQCAAGRAY